MSLRGTKQISIGIRHKLAKRKHTHFVILSEVEGHVRYSTKIGDLAGGVSSGDPSFLGMKRLP